MVADLQKQLKEIREREQRTAQQLKERMYHPAFDPLVREMMTPLFETELCVPHVR